MSSCDCRWCDLPEGDDDYEPEDYEDEWRSDMIDSKRFDEDDDDQD